MSLVKCPKCKKATVTINAGVRGDKGEWLSQTVCCSVLVLPDKTPATKRGAS